MPAKALRKWVVLGPAMFVPCMGSVVYFVLFSEYAFARVVYAAVKAFTVAWPVICICLILHEHFPRPEIPAPKYRRALALGLLSGIVIAALMLSSMRTPLLHVVESGSMNIRTKTAELGILQYYSIYALLISLINSLVEEYYWRWFLYGRLRGLVRIHWAHILAGIAFASHHTVVTTHYFGVGWGLALGACVGVGGIIWSMMYENHNTILGAWISHLIVDLALFSIGHMLLFGTYI
jgi:membrane protease YdiL (CAAX protease family)